MLKKDCNSYLDCQASCKSKSRKLKCDYCLLYAPENNLLSNGSSGCGKVRQVAGKPLNKG